MSGGQRLWGTSAQIIFRGDEQEFFWDGGWKNIQTYF